MKSIIKIYVFLLSFGQQQLQSHSNGIETIQIAGHTIYSNAVNFKCLYGAEDRNPSEFRFLFPMLLECRYTKWKNRLLKISDNH